MGIDVVVCDIKSLILPRIIPSNVFVSYRYKSIVDKTNAHPALSPVIIINESFDIDRRKGEKISLTFAVHALSKEGFSLKFSDAIIEVPEDLSEPAYVHAKSSSSIGDFDVELCFSLDPEAEPQENPKPSVLIDEYETLANEISPEVQIEKKPELYTKADDILQRIADYNKTDLTKQDLTRIDGVYAKLLKSYKKVHARYKLVTNTILSLMEKQYLYVTDDGTIMSIAHLHSTDIVRYPLISVVICQAMQEFFSQDVGFSPDVIDQYFLEICTFFAGITSNDETGERGTFYLIASVNYIMTYAVHNFPNQLETFVPVLFMTAKQALIQILDQYVEELHLSRYMRNPELFAHFITERANNMDDFLVPNQIRNDVLKYLWERYDYALALEWLERPFDVNISKITELSSLHGYSMSYMNAIHFISTNAEKIIKKKVKMDAVDPIARGSFVQKIFETLITTKKLNAKPKQLAAVIENPQKQVKIQGTTDFVEVYCNPSFTSLLPKSLPIPKWDEKI